MHSGRVFSRSWRHPHQQILVTSGFLSSQFIIQPRHSLVLTLIRYQKESPADVPIDINSILVSKPSVNSIPSLLSPIDSDLIVADWRERTPSSVWVNGAFSHEASRSYPFLLHPPHYDLPFRSDESPEITRSRVLPSSRDCGDSVPASPSMKAKETEWRGTWSLELSAGNCLQKLADRLLRIVLREEVSVGELAKRFCDEQPRGWYVEK